MALLAGILLMMLGAVAGALVARLVERVTGCATDDCVGGSRALREATADPALRTALAGATAATFLAVGAGARAGIYPAVLVPVLLYWAAIALALTVIDIRHHRLPNAIMLPSYVVTAVLLVAASAVSGDYGRLFTAACGCLALLLVYASLAAIVPGGMGLGDVKLAGALGMLLGWAGWGPLVVGAFAAFLLGGLVSAGLLVARRATRSSRIPFGPFMLAGAAVGISMGAVISGV